MTLKDIRERVDTLAARAIGGADIDKVVPLRDALYSAIIDALIAFSPNGEIVDARELQGQLNALTGAGVDFMRRQFVVRRALEDIMALLDRIDPSKRSPNVRPNPAQVWHER